MQQDNAAIVRRLLEEVSNQGKLDVADELLAADVVGHNAGRPDEHGVAEFRQAVADTRTAFPDLHFTINELVAQGDSVAAGTTVSGTHTGPLVGRLAGRGDIPSIPPTGRRGSLTCLMLFHLRGGQVTEYWLVFDNLSLMQQLGLIQADAPATVGAQQQAQPPLM